MERELYRRVYQIVWSVGQTFRTPRVRHRDWQIAMVYFWAVIHDRPTYWACRACHWPAGSRRIGLPSASTMSRRLRRPEIQQLLDMLERRLREHLWQEDSRETLYVDGKPLAVGGLSGDPDATVGYGAGKIIRGYKLHIICDQRAVPLVWAVRGVHESEHQVAQELVGRLEAAPGYLVGDGNYDKNSLYDRAGQWGWQLVAPQHKGRNLGHRRHSQFRLQARRIKAGTRRRLLKGRGTIERMLGTLCSGASGLGPLPSWVRCLHRVRLWVQAKIILYCARTCLRQGAT